eukprot:s1038_g4.t1
MGDSMGDLPDLFPTSANTCGPMPRPAATPGGDKGRPPRSSEDERRIEDRDPRAESRTLLELTTRKTETSSGAGGDEPKGTQPPVQTKSDPGETPLTAEQEKTLEHLQGLQSVGVQLTEAMVQQLQELSARQSAQVASKSLTHGHLNRLNKIKNQIQTAGKKITDLDGEWAIFIDKTMSKVREHARLYQEYRADLLEAYNPKMQDFQLLKEEVSEASKSMLGQTWMAPTIPEPPNTALQMEAVQEVIDVEGQVGQIDLTEDMEEDEMEEQKMPDGNIVKQSPNRPKSFRASTSPLKVANQTLKIKQDKEKQKEDKQNS